MKLHADPVPESGTSEISCACGHMQNLLEKTADGRENPLQKWYAKAHSRQCGCCQHELNRLEEAATKGS
jgi:hypothetical protein